MRRGRRGRSRTPAPECPYIHMTCTHTHLYNIPPGCSLSPLLQRTLFRHLKAVTQTPLQWSRNRSDALRWTTGPAGRLAGREAHPAIVAFPTRAPKGGRAATRTGSPTSPTSRAGSSLLDQPPTLAIRRESGAFLTPRKLPLPDLTPHAQQGQP